MSNAYESYCEKCGAYIPAGTHHACTCSTGLPTEYNYKCPDCGGRFNTPAMEGVSSTSNPNQRCPFCGLIMEGLN